MVIRQYSTVDTWAPGRPPPCRAAPAGSGRPGRFQLLIFLFSCIPARGTGAAQEPPGIGHFLPHASRVGKRAWIKAQRQACQQGHTWYRGRIVWSAGVPHRPATAQPSRGPRRPRPGATPRGATARLRIMTLNVGHMSAFLWGELKAYLGSSACDYDVVCLQELHWSQTCQFSVGGWSAVVSAGPDRSDGVMVLVSPKFKQSQVKYDEIVKGTTVVVLGDFNAELVPSPGRVGQSLANTPRHVGPEAPSPHALTRALEEMELVALNTWCSRTPHTNFTSTGNSQIDFIWVRGASADKIARKCQPTDPAIGSWRYMGHKQLVASIRLIKHYHLAKPQGGQPGVDRNTLSEHVRVNHPSTSALRSQVQAALSREGNSTPTAALHKLNAILLEGRSTRLSRRPARTAGWTLSRSGSSVMPCAGTGAVICRAFSRLGFFHTGLRSWLGTPDVGT